MKTCSQCGLTKPLAAFRKRKGTTYVYAYCNECSARRKRERYEQVRRELAGDLAEKSCGRCKQVLPIEEFPWGEPRSAGRSAACSSCLDPEGSRRCGRCQKIKPVTEFGRRRNGRYHEQYCKPCMSEYQMAMRYNLSPDELELIRRGLEGCCAICGKSAALGVDHNHSCCPGHNKTCGKCRRGLLCASCNNGLGRFFDDPDLLRKAADYLDFWKAILPQPELFSLEEVPGGHRN